MYRVVPNLRTLLKEEFLNLISTNATRQIYQMLSTEYLTSVFAGTNIRLSVEDIGKKSKLHKLE
jgi:hypothetical protein